MTEFSDHQIKLLKGEVEPADNDEWKWLQKNANAEIPKESSKSDLTPPSLDQLGPASQVISKDLSKVNPAGPSTHADHVAKGMEEAEARLDRGPRKD